MDDRRSLGWDIYAKIVNWNWNGVITAVDEENINSIDYSLSQNFPNPFNPTTKIKFAIPSVTLSGVEGSLVTLKVYDVLGNEVATLVNEEKRAGEYEVEFNVAQINNLSSGIYFYQLKTGNFTKTKKMLLIK